MGAMDHTTGDLSRPLKTVCRGMQRLPAAARAAQIADPAGRT